MFQPALSIQGVEKFLCPPRWHSHPETQFYPDILLQLFGAKLPIQSHTYLTMHQGELSLLACGISIILQYMNDSLGQHDITQWTLKASRCETFLAGRSFLLQCCGRATFLASIYQMWSLCTNALYLLETTRWPDMPAEMRMHITTPEIPLKISAILRSAWVPYHPRLNLALAALVRFKAWFLENFDPVAHRDTGS